jgi:hypothetical protein
MLAELSWSDCTRAALTLRCILAAALCAFGTSCSANTDAVEHTARVAAGSATASSAPVVGSVSSTGETPARPALCGSGGTEFTFQYGEQLGGGSGGGGSIGFLLRNGGTFLRVDADCNYWVIRGRDRAAVRRGTLSPSQVEELARDVRWEAWRKWYGRVVESEVLDPSSTSLMDTVGRFGCSMLCESPVPGQEPLGQELAPVVAQAERWLDELYAQGTPLDGSVRVVGKLSSLQRQYWNPDALSMWQASVSLNSIVFDDENTPIGGALMAGADAAYLRQLRNDAEVRYQSVGFFGGFIGIDDGERIIELLISDALPQENSEGFVPLPSFSGL